MRPKPLLVSRHYASMGLDVGMRACVLPTGKSPPLTPLGKLPGAAELEDVSSSESDSNMGRETPEEDAAAASCARCAADERFRVILGIRRC